MALEPNGTGDFPKVARSAYVHPTATILGNVIVEEEAFIGPGAVIRADEPGPDGKVRPIIIGEQVNVQDCAVVHALGGSEVNVGHGSSITHAAVVHGPCDIGANCLIGFNSVVFRATLGNGVIVMHQALVEGVNVPPALHVPSMTAVQSEEDVRRLGPAPPDLVAFAQKVTRVNLQLREAALKAARGE
ncbi:MAG: carbonate dehydratase [Planctomycetes bacterium]|nr:carbonate dehydratase [Planctomycetota bacterium]